MHVDAFIHGLSQRLDISDGSNPHARKALNESERLSETISAGNWTAQHKRFHYDGRASLQRRRQDKCGAVSHEHIGIRGVAKKPHPVTQV